MFNPTLQTQTIFIFIFHYNNSSLNAILQYNFTVYLRLIKFTYTEINLKPGVRTCAAPALVPGSGTKATVGGRVVLRRQEGRHHGVRHDRRVVDSQAVRPTI